jgi:TonB family protein
MKILIEIASLHVFFYLIYHMLLRKESEYSKQRIYLIAMTLLSVMIPFIELPAPEVIQNVNKVYQVDMPTMTFLASTSSASSGGPTLEETTLMGLAVISFVLLAFIFASIIGVISLYRNSSPKPYGDKYIWINQKVTHSFSFFNWIFSNTINPSIISHELAHVRLGHSYDVLFFQFFRAAFWWLPTSWMVLREAKLIHEYQADSVAVREHNIDEYQQLLISSTLSSMGWGLASSFHDGVLLKRLKAMHLTTKKISNWKISTLGVLVAIITFTFACEELDQDIKAISEDSRQLNFEDLPSQMQTNLKDKSDQLSYLITYIEESDNKSIKEKLAKMEEVDPSLIEMVEVTKLEKGADIYIALKKDAVTYEYLEQKSKAADEVFTLVDEKPSYPGGMTAFYEFIATNLNYPKAASKAGIQGRVFVQFIVDTDGSLTDIKTLKGIGNGCDEEAERVLSIAPKFTPGKHEGKSVKVRMVLPIIYSLDEPTKEDLSNKIIEYKSEK